jgi:hypothetical protein
MTATGPSEIRRSAARSRSTPNDARAAAAVSIDRVLVRELNGSLWSQERSQTVVDAREQPITRFGIAGIRTCGSRDSEVQTITVDNGSRGSSSPPSDIASHLVSGRRGLTNRPAATRLLPAASREAVEW